MIQPCYAYRVGRGVCLAFALMIPIQPTAVEGQEGPLTLQDCLSIAMERNPLIRSAQERYQASLARIRSARALPQPSLDVDSDLMSTPTNLRGADERYVGISQTIPFPGRTWLQGRVAQEESAETLADADLQREELAFQVKTAFFGVLLAGELLDHARQNLELTRDFVRMTEVRYEAGDLAQVELVRARLEEAKAASDLRAKQNGVRLARSRMNFLLARESSEPLELEGELKVPALQVDLDKLTTMALESRPEMHRINASMARESLIKSQGYLSYLPDFDVGLAKHRQTGEDDTWDMTLSVSLPVFFWQPVRGEIAEANANYRGLREEAAHLTNAIALEVQEAFVDLTTAADQISLFEEQILNQAQEAYQMYEFAYQQGEIGAMDLIEARRTLNEARTSYADALYTYDVAQAGIEKSVGRPMEDQNHAQLPSQSGPLFGRDGRLLPDSLSGDSQPEPGYGPGRLRLRSRLRRGAGGGGGQPGG